MGSSMALKHCFLGVFGGESSGGWLVGLGFRVKVILQSFAKDRLIAPSS